MENSILKTSSESDKKIGIRADDLLDNSLYTIKFDT